MNTRIKNVSKFLRSQNLDALLVTKEANVSYLSASQSSESWMVITRTKAYYLTDSRYILEVKKALKGIDIICYDKSFYHSLVRLVETKKIKTLGYNPDHLTVSQFERLGKVLKKSCKLDAVSNIVEQFRQQKDQKELRKIKLALSVHKQAHQYLKRIVKPGVTENEVLLKLENFVKSRGYGLSFDTIVASGPNSCYPHARVTARKIRNNEIVLIDMGVDVNGYKSDLTRMFFLGKIPALIWDVHCKVQEAQRRAINIVKPGIKIADVDNQARNYLKENKLASCFGHALGHGVGLEIHEDPRICGQNPDVLQENMVITIEPGVYIPHKFGIRLEEMVLVTKNGYKVLSDDIH